MSEGDKKRKIKQRMNLQKHVVVYLKIKLVIQIKYY